MAQQPPGPPEGGERPQQQGWGQPPPRAQGPPTHPQWGAAPPPQPPRPKPPLYRRPWFIIVGCVVLVLIGAGLLGDPPAEESAQPIATAAPTTVATTLAPTTTEVPTTIEPTTTAKPTTTTKPKPVAFKLPNVKNRILYDAITMLEDAGVNLDNVEYEWRLIDNGPPINPTNWAVVGQRPKAGTRVTARSKVVLEVVRTDTGF